MCVTVLQQGTLLAKYKTTEISTTAMVLNYDVKSDAFGAKFRFFVYFRLYWSEVLRIVFHYYTRSCE